MYVKICGLRSPEHAMLAASYGADAIGVVMSEPSPRHATPEEASAVIAAARTENPAIDTVLVVREMAAVDAAAMANNLGFDVLQLHGGYSAAEFAKARALHPRIWRAASLATTPGLRAGTYDEERLLVDSAVAGSGESWDLNLINGAELGQSWLLAGGLNPDNVADAIRSARPGGVDVSSGIEIAPGEKSPELIERFIAAARSV